jgi:hypothetical protein
MAAENMLNFHGTSRNGEISRSAHYLKDISPRTSPFIANHAGQKEHHHAGCGNVGNPGDAGASQKREL